MIVATIAFLHNFLIFFICFIKFFHTKNSQLKYLFLIIFKALRFIRDHIIQNTHSFYKQILAAFIILNGFFRILNYFSINLFPFRFLKPLIKNFNRRLNHRMRCHFNYKMFRTDKFRNIIQNLRL